MLTTTQSDTRRDEMLDSGYKVVKGEELRVLKDDLRGHGVPLKSRGGGTALYNRRCVLLIGMLLETGVSEEADLVKRYLLDVEQNATPVQRQVAVQQVAQPQPTTEGDTPCALREHQGCVAVRNDAANRL